MMMKSLEGPLTTLPDLLLDVVSICPYWLMKVVWKIWTHLVLRMVKLLLLVK